VLDNKANVNPTRSYTIANLFFVALIGGSFALVFFGFANARMLKVSSARFYLMLMSMLSIFVIKFLVLVPNSGIMVIPVIDAVPILRIPDLILFLIFYHILRLPYRIHMIMNYEVTYLLPRALVVCLLSILLEGVILEIISPTEEG